MPGRHPGIQPPWLWFCVGLMRATSSENVGTFDRVGSKGRGLRVQTFARGPLPVGIFGMGVGSITPGAISLPLWVPHRELTRPRRSKTGVAGQKARQGQETTCTRKGPMFRAGRAMRPARGGGGALPRASGAVARRPRGRRGHFVGVFVFTWRGLLTSLRVRDKSWRGQG